MGINFFRSQNLQPIGHVMFSDFKPILSWLSPRCLSTSKHNLIILSSIYPILSYHHTPSLYFQDHHTRQETEDKIYLLLNRCKCIFYILHATLVLTLVWGGEGRLEAGCWWLVRVEVKETLYYAYERQLYIYTSKSVTVTAIQRNTSHWWSLKVTHLSNQPGCWHISIA